MNLLQDQQNSSQHTPLQQSLLICHVMLSFAYSCFISSLEAQLEGPIPVERTYTAVCKSVEVLEDARRLCQMSVSEIC